MEEVILELRGMKGGQADEFNEDSLWRYLETSLDENEVMDMISQGMADTDLERLNKILNGMCFDSLCMMPRSWTETNRKPLGGPNHTDPIYGKMSLARNQVRRIVKIQGRRVLI